MGCGFKGKLVWLVSLGVGRHCEPAVNLGACRKTMQSMVRRVASKLAAAVLETVLKEAERLLAAGQYAAAAAQLNKGVNLGNLPSRAHLADLLRSVRNGIVKDFEMAFRLAEEGVRFGCHHCQGVIACCYVQGLSMPGLVDDEANIFALALESAGKGSKYGQFALGQLRVRAVGVAPDHVAALAQYRLAASQHYDWAQHSIGLVFMNGHGVSRNYAEALRWFKLAAAQGLAAALHVVGLFFQEGYGVSTDITKAIRWYKRAAAAGHDGAARVLRRLQHYGE